MKSDQAFTYLAQAHDAGRLAHAYIVVGDPKTVGAALAVRILQKIFCKQRGAPCGGCTVCRHVAQRTHEDALWVEPQMKSRQIGVEAVRETIQQRMQQTAYAGQWKACVIVGSDRLGREAANAFLKTLEEPTGSSLFLLLTDTPQLLLATIVSRCQMLVLHDDAPGQSAWDRRLIAILTEGGAQAPSALLAAMAQSERIVALLKEMKAAATEEIEAAADAAAVEAEDETLDARASSLFREQRTALMRTLLLWYRDRLILACGGDEARVALGEHLAVLKAQVRGVSRATALRHVRVVEELHDQLERNMPEPLVFGCGLPRLVAV